MSLVKSFSVGNGDMFYIKHNSDNFTIIDCCLIEDEQERILDEIRSASSGKGIKRLISSHPDNDHILGLIVLDEQEEILNFYCVKNEATKEDPTEDFDKYCELRDSSKKAFYLFEGCSRKWMNVSDETRQTAGIQILWPKTDNEHFKDALAAAKEGDNPNNISPIVKYSVQDGAVLLWMGDLEAEFLENIQDEVHLPKTDILFAPHHGRDSGKVPQKLLDQIQPKIIVIGEAPSEHLHYYVGYDTITQNSAGDIAFECVDGAVHVFVSEDGYSADFLDDGGQSNRHGNYIGTLTVHAKKASR
jgi:beta-lactamase superfamily II metal-dependent hydrolase